MYKQQYLDFIKREITRGYNFADLRRSLAFYHIGSIQAILDFDDTSDEKMRYLKDVLEAYEGANSYLGEVFK